jgi:hypothetical protein
LFGRLQKRSAWLISVKSGRGAHCNSEGPLWPPIADIDRQFSEVH